MHRGERRSQLEARTMLSLGVLLVILGIGSFVLPMIGYQFTLMDPIEEYQPWAGIIVAAVGLITVLWAGRRRAAAQSQTTVVSGSPPPPAPRSDTE